MESCVCDPKPSMESGKTQLATDKSLLLLGLQLLNKGLKLPTAVVSPHVRPEQQPASPPLKPSGEAASRKRKREPEESTEQCRRAKRKMMNRVAAQNARDRKKAYVEDLELKVALLEEQNQKLLCENHQLKKEAAASEQPEHYLVSSGVAREEGGLTGSAAPCVSLQQKPVPQTPLAHFLLLVSLCHWLETSSFVHDQATLWEDLTLPQLMTMLLGNQHARRPQWWGAWERKWSPPKKRA